MICMNSRSPPQLPSLPNLKHRNQLPTTPQHLWLSTHHSSTPFPLATRRRRHSTMSFSLGPNSPANAGNLSVLIPTSIVLFFAYWVTNFVVPGIISRYLGLDKRGESEEPDEKR